MAGSIQGPERRIVIVGKSGSGKSATGNTILGNDIFEFGMSLNSATMTCQKEETRWNGRRIVVVDTPGLDTNVPDWKTIAEVNKCVKFCPPGPHAILWVMRFGYMSQKEKDMKWGIQELFSQKGKNYMIILFTGKDHMEDTDICLEELISCGNSSLQEQLAQCGNRFLAFNNRAKREERDAQVVQLLKMIDELVCENGNAPCYTEDMLREDMKNFREIHGASRCSLL